MATSVETMWVADDEQLQATVRTLVSQGGKVQTRAPDEVRLFLKKKLNLVALIGGLVLFIVPGLVYLIWYLTADADQDITIRVGTPASVRTDHPLWQDDVSGPAPTPAPEGRPTPFGRRDPGAPETGSPADLTKPGGATTERMPGAEYPVVPAPPPPPPPPTI